MQPNSSQCLFLRKAAHLRDPRWSTSSRSFIVPLPTDDAGKTPFRKNGHHRFIDYINDETIASAPCIPVMKELGNLGAARRTPQLPNSLRHALSSCTISLVVLINLNLIDDYPTFESPLKKRARRQSARQTCSHTPNAEHPPPFGQHRPQCPSRPLALPSSPSSLASPSDDVVAQYAEIAAPGALLHQKARRRAEERKVSRLHRL